MKQKRLELGLAVKEVCMIAEKKYGYTLQPIFIWKLEDPKYRDDAYSVKIYLLSLIYECDISDFYDLEIEEGWVNTLE